MSPLVQEMADHVQGGGFANVVGVGFECQAPDGDLRPGERPVEFLLHLLDKSPFLALVDGLNRLHKEVLVTDGAGDMLEGGHVLGEAASAEAAPVRKNAGPIRLSLPMPLRTSSISAP